MSIWMEKIHEPQDLSALSVEDMEELCSEIRQKIIETVSCNGGHLASNLGVVELTVALHRVFSEKGDCILWDVGHQAYTHKILTGRADKISTIRTQGGLVGFPNRQESPYDFFNVGHASTSISAALGIANAKKIQHDPGHVIAVIGDGALTGGLSYEGLNNAGRFSKNFIVVLNDNKMSISKNVGSMARYLAHIRTRPGYLKMKGNLESTLHRLPIIGASLREAVDNSKAALKHLLYNNTIFEDMGFAYYGPFDGHNLAELMDVFENAKNIDHPILIHVLTSKGKGYQFAEKNPGAFHGVSHFDISTGKSKPSGENFSGVFGALMCEAAIKDKRIVAITAAMQTGTGLTEFGRRFPDRFFDVGIAEEHAVTFAGGLAAGGMLPVCTLYSTFLQRGYDQLIHDIALQKVHAVFAIDRAGIVGEDGETHQGVFDVAFLNSIPGATVFSPCYYEEMHTAFDMALNKCRGLSAVRYPRGKEQYKPNSFHASGKSFDVWGDSTAKIALVTYGRLFSFACLAQEELKKRGISLQIIKLNRIKPIDYEAVQLAGQKEVVYFFEEGMRQAGTGEHFACLLQEIGFAGNYHLKAIEQFVPHASMEQSLNGLGLDADGMVKLIEKTVK